jgi:hypothetical protein
MPYFTKSDRMHWAKMFEAADATDGYMRRKIGYGLYADAAERRQAIEAAGRVRTSGRYVRKRDKELILDLYHRAHGPYFHEGDPTSVARELGC